MGSLIILAALFIGIGFLARRQHSRQSPLQYAISATAVGTVFIVTGLLGLQLDKHNYTLITGSWTGGVLWWKVLAGAGILLFSVYFWRKGLLSVR